jgi:hypothetical protein
MQRQSWKMRPYSCAAGLTAFWVCITKRYGSAGVPRDSRDDDSLDAAAGDAGGIERRLEALADEMGQLIECGRVGDREALHDYAVSLLRDRLPTTATNDEPTVEEIDEAPAARPGAGTNAATLIGYGFILLPAGAVLLLVFPPVGMLLFGTGVMSMAGGVVLAVFVKAMSRSAVAAQALKLFGNRAR